LENPNEFDPTRWQTENGKTTGQRTAYILFLAVPHVYTGAGFAMIEGVVLLAQNLAEYRLDLVPERRPVPVARLTACTENGI
jgi:cytochrome P450